MGKHKIIISKNKYKKYKKQIKELQHFKDTVIGLWATDRPDLIDDPEKIMFQID
jgi:hypothetical protein